MALVAVAGKIADVVLVGTRTETGTTRVGVEVESDTTVPPMGAVCERVTVHVVGVLDPRVIAPHCRDMMAGADPITTTEDLEDPFNVALIEIV